MRAEGEEKRARWREDGGGGGCAPPQFAVARAQTPGCASSPMARCLRRQPGPARPPHLQRHARDGRAHACEGRGHLEKGALGIREGGKAAPRLSNGGGGGLTRTGGEDCRFPHRGGKRGWGVDDSIAGGQWIIARGGVMTVSQADRGSSSLGSRGSARTRTYWPLPCPAPIQTAPPQSPPPPPPRLRPSQLRLSACAGGPPARRRRAVMRRRRAGNSPRGG